MDSQAEQISLIQHTLDEQNEQIKDVKETGDYLKGRFGPPFIAKLDKTFAAVGAMEYDLMVFKTNIKSFVQRTDMENIEKRVLQLAPLAQVQMLERQVSGCAS